MNDRLYRSRTDRVISGVAGGVAERLDIDPSIVRIVWVILALLSGGLLGLVYLVMMVVVPEAPFDAPGRFGGGTDPWSTAAATGIRPVAPAGGPSPAGEPGATDDPGEAGATWDAGSTGAVAHDQDDTAAFAAVSPPSVATDAERGAWPAVGTSQWAARPHTRAGRRGDRGGGLIFGVILILVGAYFLIREYLPEVDLDATWPVIVVAAGVLLVLLALVPDRSRR
jgi:phage shock protein PspC (stress-responsive transcriptional regulator)